MKIKLVSVLTKVSLLSAMLLVTAVASAQGQSLAYRIRANVPFDFSIGDNKLPSGKYSIGRARSNSDDTVLSVDDLNGHWRAVRASSAVQTLNAKNKPTLVFHRYGDQYFLYQVWPAGETTGRQFFKSRSEREIQRNLSGNSAIGKMSKNAEIETVTLVGVLQ